MCKNFSIRANQSFRSSSVSYKSGSCFENQGLCFLNLCFLFSEHYSGSPRGAGGSKLPQGLKVQEAS